MASKELPLSVLLKRLDTKINSSEPGSSDHILFVELRRRIKLNSDFARTEIKRRIDQHIEALKYLKTTL